MLHKGLSLALLCSCSKCHLSSQLTSRSTCPHLPHRAIQAISLRVLNVNFRGLINYWSTHFDRMQRYQRILRLLIGVIEALQMFNHDLWKVSFLALFVLWRPKKPCTFDTATTLALLFLCNFLLWVHIKLFFRLDFQTRLFILFFWKIDRRWLITIGRVAVVPSLFVFPFLEVLHPGVMQKFKESDSLAWIFFKQKFYCFQTFDADVRNFYHLRRKRLYSCFALLQVGLQPHWVVSLKFIDLYFFLFFTFTRKQRIHINRSHWVLVFDCRPKNANSLWLFSLALHIFLAILFFGLQ